MHWGVFPNWRPALLSLHLGLQIKTGYGAACSGGLLYFASAVLPQLVGIKLCCQIAYNFFDRAEEKHLRSCASQDKCFFVRCSGIVAFRQTLTPRAVQLLLVNCIAISILLHFFAGILFNCSLQFLLCCWIFLRVSVKHFLSPNLSLLLVNFCLHIAVLLCRFHCCWSICVCRLHFPPLLVNFLACTILERKHRNAQWQRDNLRFRYHKGW